MSAVLPPYAQKDQARGDRVKVLSRVTATLGGGKKRVAQLGPGRNVPISIENGSRRARLGWARSFHTNVSSDIASSTGGLSGAVAGPYPDQQHPPVGLHIRGSFPLLRPCRTANQCHNTSFPQP